MKIRRVGAKFFHAERRTDGWLYGQADVTELIVAFRNFELLKPTKTQQNAVLMPVLREFGHLAENREYSNEP
jgi:hypothetical protein